MKPSKDYQLFLDNLEAIQSELSKHSPLTPEIYKQCSVKFNIKLRAFKFALSSLADPLWEKTVASITEYQLDSLKIIRKTDYPALSTLWGVPIRSIRRCLSLYGLTTVKKGVERKKLKKFARDIDVSTLSINWGDKLKEFHNLPLSINKHGYVEVTKNSSNYLVHRLLAKTYIPNPKGHPVVHHKNHNPLDNSISNLQWVSEIGHAILHIKSKWAQEKLEPFF